MNLWRRPFAAATAVAALVSTALVSTALVSPPAGASTLNLPAGPVAAAADFATETWSDPWDFAAAGDLLLDGKGPTLNLAHQRVAGGMLRFDVTRPGYFSPLWTGYPHALQLARDGSLAANTVDTGRFTKVALQVYASVATSAAVFWFGCANQSGACMGGKPFSVRPGWNTYEIPMVNDPRFHLRQAWTGRVRGLRIAFNKPRVPLQVAVDWVRLYHPDPALQVAGGPLQWTDTSGDGSGRYTGWLADGDVSALPPGSYTVSDGTDTGQVSLLPPPAPVVLSPDAAGAPAAGAPCVHWGLRSPRDVAKLVNVTARSWRGGLTGRNAGPVINDPQVWLRLPHAGLDARTLHRLTVNFRSDLPFDLTDTAHGGTHGRVVWYDARRGLGTPVQTKPWPTYQSQTTMTFDLAGSPSSVFEESRGARYRWGSARVVGLRWDPDETRGPASWHLTGVQLCGDDRTQSGGFTIRWSQATAGTVTLSAAGTTIAVLPDQAAGVNSYVWQPDPSLRGQKATVTVRVDAAGGTGTATSTGPVDIR